MPKFARITGVIALLLPTAGIPLGLGDIELHSALNQPLNAEIGLLDVSPTSLDHVQVSLASGDEFEKLGLDRPSFLSSLTMEVRKDKSGRQFINLTSSEAIREPFIDLLLAVSWPQGRLVKEYTMLLDPPVFLDTTAAPVSAPATTVPSTVSGGATQPAAETAMTPAAVSKTAPDSFDSSRPAGFTREADGTLSYGPVQRSDTLWSIAQTYKSEDEVSAPQIMMALLRENPEAFYNSNSNELKAGYVLRIRHPEAVSAMSQAAAEAELRRQYSAWRAAKEGRPMNVTPEAGASAGAGQGGAVEGAAGGPHLELASAEAGKEGAAAGVDSEGLGVGTASRADVLAAIEASDVAQQENKALRDRLAMLEKQIADMQRLLVLKGDTMTALQAKGAEVIQPSTTDAGAAEAAPARPEAKGDATTVVAVAKPETKPAPVAKPAPAEEQSFLDELLGDNLWYVVSGGGVLLLLMALLAKRRQGMKDAIDLAAGYSDDDESVFEISVPASNVEDSAVAATAEAVAEGNEATAESLLNEVQGGEYAGAGIADDDIDTLSEADVYLAYRRFDKAEQLLKDALQHEPDRRDLQLKLLEVYAKSENKDAFADRAEALHVMLNDDESEVWQKVMRLGQPLLGRHPLFGGSGGDVAEVVAEPEAHEEAVSDDVFAEEAEPEDDIGQIFADEVVAADETDEVADTGLKETAVTAGDEVDEPEAEVAVTEEDRKAVDHRDIPLEYEIAALEQRLDGVQEDDAGEVAVDKGDAANTVEFDAVASTSADDASVAQAEEEPVAEAAVETEAERETEVSEAKSKEVKDGDINDEDMAWLDEVVDADLDDLIGGGGDLMNLNEDDMDFSGPISGEDNFATNLDLARAYIDMGDMEAARTILEGLDGSLTDMQRSEIQELMKRIA
ncbi:MAG: hypothetical protein GC138_02480 [Gammaproteobacteria bacterium]|nr:hypothetical protein [Gammaproteobacteria bacterium]